MSEQSHSAENARSETEPQSSEVVNTTHEKEIESLKTELDREHARAEEYLKRLQYLQADFENFRKRVERERIEAEKVNVSKLVSEILTILDELELALEAIKRSDDKQEMINGIQVVYTKTVALLRKEGLEPIESVGTDFDPDLHEAVGEVAVPLEKVGKVVEEIRKGFMFDGKVLRPSSVKIGVLERRNHS